MFLVIWYCKDSIFFAMSNTFALFFSGLCCYDPVFALIAQKSLISHIILRIAFVDRGFGM